MVIYKIATLRYRFVRNDDMEIATLCYRFVRNDDTAQGQGNYPLAEREEEPRKAPPTISKPRLRYHGDRRTSPTGEILMSLRGAERRGNLQDCHEGKPSRNDPMIECNYTQGQGDYPRNYNAPNLFLRAKILQGNVRVRRAQKCLAQLVLREGEHPNFVLVVYVHN